MNSDEIRKKFLDFFGKKGHKIIPSASLIPENDPTVLFTTAGMHPLVPYLLGQHHPLGKRLCSVQKCLRTDDIDETGDKTHLTFFEMLGNWSLGDYFKKEAIEWSFEFLTKELGLAPENLAISVFAGEKENNIPRDEDSVKIWRGLGIAEERICYLGRKDNWWGPAGKTGPCGPDTEMFYWAGKTKTSKKFDPADKNWFEIWNDVFMEYNKDEEGRFKPLKQKNVDTGMGLERMAAVLQGRESVFQTDLFSALIAKIQELATKQDKRAERIVADHLKASVFILAEKIPPANLERGYVLRRLIRRAIRYGKLLGIEKEFACDVTKEIIRIYEKSYPEVKKEQGFILNELASEETRFKKTLGRGLREFQKMSADGINGKEAFDLYQTYGFPIEMTKELAKERGVLVDEKEFQEELTKHQRLSRTASRGRFKAGLADQSEKTIGYHTATHLLHSALRKILGKEIKQVGSNITAERLRFDFTFTRKLQEAEIKKVEDLVNQAIKRNLRIKVKEMPLQQAIRSGALAFFKERYPEKVKIYVIFNPQTNEVFSKEICAGPHCQRISELGKFKILKEESCGANVRRIRAILMNNE